jgi:hypothetical protein
MTYSHFAVAFALLLGAMAICPAQAAGPATKAQAMPNTAQAAPAATAGVTKQHVVGGDDEVRNESARAHSKPIK